MTDIRFAKKGGQSVDGSIICQRFFAAATASGIKPDHASAVWHDAMHGDPPARELIEEMCDIEIVNWKPPKTSQFWRVCDSIDQVCAGGGDARSGGIFRC